jgi:hypothetical protein
MKFSVTNKKPTASFGIVGLMLTIVPLGLMLAVVNTSAQAQASGTPSPADWTEFLRDNGAGHTKFVLGKHSGRHALLDRLEKLGHPLDRNQIDEVYTRFAELADRKKSIHDQDLLGLLTVPVSDLEINR